MKTKKKVTSMFLVLTMSSCLIACGNSTPAIGNDVVSIEESTGTESSEAESTEASTEIVESSSADTEVAGAGGEEEPAVTASPEPTATANPTPEPTSTPTPTPEPTPTPHIHEWTETVTRAAGCASDGEKKLTCECGEEKVESIPSTGNHNWVEGTTVVHHEALGHVEEVQVQTGTTAGYTVYSCGICGASFDTPSGVSEHCKSFIGVDNTHVGARTVMTDYPGEPVYETQAQWVVDVQPWDEVVGTGTYTCSVCGATK